MNSKIYQKPFDEWFPVKKQVHERTTKIVFKEGETWWCNIGINVGFETDGKGRAFARPVLIIKKFSRTMFFAVPFTSKFKSGNWYAPLEIEKDITSYAILSQARAYDTKRLQRKISDVDLKEFAKIKKQLGELLGFF